MLDIICQNGILKKHPIIETGIYFYIKGNTIMCQHYLVHTGNEAENRLDQIKKYALSHV